MDEIVRQAVVRAIVTMRDNLGERLTIDDLARAAMFSKFHFTRVFLRATGLSPGRFLSAPRVADRQSRPGSGTTVRGQLRVAPSAQGGPVFVGRFAARIAEGAPARFAVLPGPGPYAQADVPLVSWYVLTHAYGCGEVDNHTLRPYTGLAGPVTVHRGVTASLADVRLRPRHGVDPPVLLALPDLRQPAVARPVAV